MTSMKSVYKFLAEFIDSEGEVSVCIAWYPAVPDTDTVSDIIDKLDGWAVALAATSNAALRSQSFVLEGIGTLTLPTPADTEKYDDVEDKLFIEFISAADGSVYKANIPAPKIADFMSDEETYAPASTALAAYIAQIASEEVTSSGMGGLTNIKGYRRRAKTRRRLRQGIPTEIGG